jgi:hypothetical protein
VLYLDEQAERRRMKESEKKIHPSANVTAQENRDLIKITLSLLVYHGIRGVLYTAVNLKKTLHLKMHHSGR